ncbi:MAG: hypothetical protein WCK53_14270 [Methanomicrobiales archaeon]
MTDKCFICGVRALNGYWDQVHSLYLCLSCAARERNNARAYEHTKNKRDIFMTTVKELRTFLKQWKNNTEITGTVWLFLNPDPTHEAVVFAELDVASMDCVIFDETAEFRSIREMQP